MALLHDKESMKVILEDVVMGCVGWVWGVLGSLI